MFAVPLLPPRTALVALNSRNPAASTVSVFEKDAVPRVAVMVAVLDASTPVVVILKLSPSPPLTVTLAGTEATLELLLRVTVTAASALPERLTRPASLAPPTTELQDRVKPARDGPSGSKLSVPVEVDVPKVAVRVTGSSEVTAVVVNVKSLS
jgi:hypothetical protein